MYRLDAVAADFSDYIFLAGAELTTYNLVILKLDENGVEQWAVMYDPYFVQTQNLVYIQ